MLKREIILTQGTPERPYCAFPSIAETEEGILCAFKTGMKHYADEGQVRLMHLDRAGNVLKNDLLAAVPEFNAQNVELVTLPNGTIQAHVDIQDYQNKNSMKTRVGSLIYAYNNGRFELLDGKLTDTDGTVFGYVFDGVVFNGQFVLVATTFRELTPDNPRQTVHLLTTDDNGHTWKNVADINAWLNHCVNETGLCVHNGKLYIAVRPTQATYMFLAAFDSEFKMVQMRRLGEEAGVYKIGRPKLFMRDGNMYMIIRNRVNEGTPMRLDLIRLDPETLLPEKFSILDNRPTQDGHYAEPYFDGNDICVFDYRYSENSTGPNIVLLRYDWDSVK